MTCTVSMYALLLNKSTSVIKLQRQSRVSVVYLKCVIDLTCVELADPAQSKGKTAYSKLVERIKEHHKASNPATPSPSPPPPPPGETTETASAKTDTNQQQVWQPN